MKKIAAAFLLLCICLSMLAGCGAKSEEAPEFSDLKYIFVHGLSGWGSYDKTYKYMPYWGMRNGDLISFLRGQGYDCYAASVAPNGSAWDRACELYAQLSGSVVDYGKEHSERCGHERYGRDFSSEPLIAGWNDGGKIVLLGHSFGGATVRLFSELLANGAPEEIEASSEDELSPFFAGGQAERIHAIVTLAAPTNGTTAYDMHADPDFDIASVQVGFWDEQMAKIYSSRKSSPPDSRASYDYAAYDMHIDNAQALNERISTLEGTYYFAVACSASSPNDEGFYLPERSLMEGLFRKSSAQMGHYSGKTAGGMIIDESWRENDGLVNTISAGAPFNAESAEYVEGMEFSKGLWYILPVFRGDHMSLQGGLTKKADIFPFYTELLGVIDTIER